MIRLFRRIFTDHPASVEESYGEHFGVASRFGLTMIRGGLGALIHAIIPALCVRTGSNTIRQLNQMIVQQRDAKAQHVAQAQSVDWVI
jgi:hypothetical protein